MSPFNGPLSTAVTRSPRWTSCQVQPPGAAPRSTARMPACRTSRSRSPRNVSSASASFSVEREGAECGIRNRGMPMDQRLPQGARLPPTYACAPSGSRTWSAGGRSRSAKDSVTARSTALAQRVREAAARSIGTGRTSPCHRSYRRSRDAVRRTAARRGFRAPHPAVQIPCKMTRSARRAARHDPADPSRSPGRTVRADPVPKNSERTNIGGLRSSARGQRCESNVRGVATTYPRPVGASTATSVSAAAAIAWTSAAASGSKPARQCATIRGVIGRCESRAAPRPHCNLHAAEVLRAVLERLARRRAIRAPASPAALIVARSSDRARRAARRPAG